MDFRTVVAIEDYGFTISHGQQGLMVGSCFAANIGERMEAGKMPVSVNPFGVMYNPLSVVRTLEMLESGDSFTEDRLRYYNGLWFSFSHHGSFSSSDKEQVLQRIDASIEKGHRALMDADYLVLTLGTAWVYQWKESGEVVGNCHKLPAKEFFRYRLEVEDIVAAFDRLFSSEIYRRKKIVLTVSPIRHLKDGAAENQLSKATLLMAVHRLAGKYENVCYFPAYELMMDDLRDYRFYEKDMVHPSTVAIDYIWERFCESLIAPESCRLFKRIEKIAAACNHRPFNPDTPQHKAFKAAMLVEIGNILKENKNLDFKDEIACFSE